MNPTSELQDHFAPFRADIIGLNTTIPTNFGTKPLVYVDWTASGRAARSVEDSVRDFLPYYGNTHSEASYVGLASTRAYEQAHIQIAGHVNAGPEDIVLFKGSGATGAINFLIYMLGLRGGNIPAEARPVVFVTHMEHHSNHTSWNESDAQVEVIRPDPVGLPDLNHLTELCQTYSAKGRKILGSFTACSNVTGVMTDYERMASIMHQHGGLCFVDFAASAPYIDINMHPHDPAGSLDAIFFSPHKFLGGPQASGVIVINSKIYENRTPVHVGGGIVKWTNPWGGRSFIEDIGQREDAGTPGVIQGFRAGLAIELKELMRSDLIAARKSELLEQAWHGLGQIPGISILAPQHKERQGIISFTVDSVHYGLMVTLLNDLYGIQARGGCSCAGTYGHYLFEIDRVDSTRITARIDAGDHSAKPGWVRISLHPTMTDQELDYVLGAIKEISSDPGRWQDLYHYDPTHNIWNFVGKSFVNQTSA